MKFSKIAKLVEGIPYTSVQGGELLYEHVLKHKPQCCLELGFAHGVASCYIAAALHEIGSGKLACVDLESSQSRNPNIETLLEKAELTDYVSIHREKNSYTWFLKKEIERQTESNQCRPVYDLCFIDGPKNWTIDGLAFFLVDKLLKQDGFVLFDDYQWAYKDYIGDKTDGISHRDMSPDQLEVPNIEMVFKLLVMQHPDYARFTIQDNWAWAQKVRDERKTVLLDSRTSLKYKFVKTLRRISKPKTLANLAP